MDIKRLTQKAKEAISKYKYAAVILLIGISLLVVPQKIDSKTVTDIPQKQNLETFKTTELVEILQSIQGAGKVKVLLSISSGEKTVYQTNTDVSSNGDHNSSKEETVIITDSQRTETGLITQVVPPTYLGAIVVCEGGDSASVKLAIIQAVSKITGLGADNICVLKMES